MVRFNLPDRMALIPVELVHILLPLVLVNAALYWLSGAGMAAATATAILAGGVFPHPVIANIGEFFSGYWTGECPIPRFFQLSFRLGAI